MDWEPSCIYWKGMFHFSCFLPFFLVLVAMSGLNTIILLLWISPSNLLKQTRGCFQYTVCSLITVAWHILKRGGIIARFCHTPTYHPHTNWWDAGFLSVTSKALLPEILSHSSHICQFARSCNASLLPFNPCHVWYHSPLFFHPHNISTAPQRSSHRVGTPLTVSSTLSGLAGEKTQQQGVGWACQRVQPPCWVTGIGAMLWSVYIPFREDIEEEGQERPTGSMWHSPYGRHGTGSTRHQGENKETPQVLVWHQCVYLCRWRTWTLQRSALLCSRIWTPAGRLRRREREGER